MKVSGPTTVDAVVIGGGLYGVNVAIALATRRPTFGSVLLVERERELLSRASLLNQARIHHGYHYPRSILTSLRSRLNYARFVSDYGECVDERFVHYYAVARGSKVTAAQFVQFCRRIGAPLTSAPSSVTRRFDADRIEAVFEVREGVFNADQLRSMLEARLARAGVEVARATDIVRATADDGIITLTDAAGNAVASAHLVVNCTYSRLNQLLRASGAASIPLQLELAEIALIEPPAELGAGAVTVIDGPYFSVMPYPTRGLHTLSHVRYTPHMSWRDDLRDVPWTGATAPPGDGPVRASRAAHMIRDAARYLPALRRARYVDSLWEVKALMPRSENDDSRPILLGESARLPGVVSVLGAKIDNVYDVENALLAWLETSHVRPAVTRV